MKNSKQPTHTQGEWELKISSTQIPMKGTLKVKGDNYGQIANLEFHQQDNGDSKKNLQIIQANAERIVFAVNMHDELIGHLKNVYETCIKMAKVNGVTGFKNEIIEQLLKQAEQK